MAVVTVYEIFDIINGDYHISATDKDGATQTLISSDDAKKYLIKRYGTRRYKVLRGAAASETEAGADLLEDFQRYIDNRQHGIDRMYQAMYDQEYSPIENVFSEETERTQTDDDLTHGLSTATTGSDTTTYNTQDAKTGTEEQGYNSTMQYQGADTNTHKVSGFNSTSLVNDNQDLFEKGSQDEHIGEDTTTYNTEVAKTGTETLAHNVTVANSGKDQRDIDTHRTYERHGNVGVTSSQELINQELALYIKSLAEMILDNFIDDYTFYS